MPYNTDIPGFMKVKELQILERLAKNVPENGTIVELGSFMGRSSWAFAKSAPSSVKVYCIDCWEGFTIDDKITLMNSYRKDLAYDIKDFKNFVKDYRISYQSKANPPKSMWPKTKKADIIFIDASHVSPDVDNDIAFWYPRLKENGLLLGHDFNVLLFPDVCRAVINFSEKVDLPIKFFKEATLWLIEKQPTPVEDEDTVVSNPYIIEEIKGMIKAIYLSKKLGYTKL